jgi:hypothetical protein
MANEQSIELTPSQERLLARMRAIEGILHREADALGMEAEPLYEEYRTLQAEAVPIFLPLVEKLVRAGLITISIDADPEDSFSTSDATYFSVTGDPNQVFENGNIWISGSHCGGGCSRDGATKGESDGE